MVSLLYCYCIHALFALNVCLYRDICVVLLLGCLGYNCNQVVDLLCIVIFVLYCFLDVCFILVIKVLTLFVLSYLCCNATWMFGL